MKATSAMCYSTFLPTRGTQTWSERKNDGYITFSTQRCISSIVVVFLFLLLFDILRCFVFPSFTYSHLLLLLLLLLFLFSRRFYFNFCRNITTSHNWSWLG
ncbi:hypothetical protein, unlikely [Trypanosoma brucei gambiense DAL972]|uniref:Uncharacterized protein n=1 Tax=Trypanosoma brucei gambiense (strain MHOM/CI/86/DAL972) TaxID=679716 RepID=C9ZW89_TRYB9|nr:hypothetical protein, unlikely [Trypanosoma brucei gambiense DAL972]CBH13678.1 hypothetical protein, unlikely [Trypanosoma brucei gambiense DAL972]|eukprot:XP_011775954.1 hypothetical protein, unlikely [Trypanosoma brucei gambiense DAL972]